MSAKTARIISNLFNLIVILALFFGPLAQIRVQAFTDTDKKDYAPGSVVTVRGDNSNFEAGKGYQPGETVKVTVTQPVLTSALICEAVVNTDGSWSCNLELSSDPALAVGLYEYTTLGLTSGTTETHFFTDANPSAKIDQCANGRDGSESCTIGNWINGNVNENKSRYMEGDSIPYRLVFTNLSIGEHTVTIEWDTTKSSTHAIDYLTTWDRSVSGDPTAGVTGTFSAPTTYVIPNDPQVTGAGVTPIPGNFTLYNGTITGTSAYSYPKGEGFDGDMTARITITFMATSATAVLAWGGHISTRLDWGMSNSAVLIPGSPYHTSLIDLDGKGGNQDLSLSTEAVIFPGSITIIKQATPEGSTSFPFTAGPAPLANFSLKDDGTVANTHVFSNITTFTTYTVTEITPAGWTFGSINCSVTSPNGGRQTPSGATVTINLKEGENVTCTYTNTRNYDQDLTVTKTATASFGRTYKWLIDKSVDDTQIEIADGGIATFHYSVKVTPDGYDDSAWAVTGKITVANPNAFAVTGVNVTDTIDNGGVCSVTGGTNVTVPASSSVELDYSCTYAAAPSPAAGTNTAKATWDASSLYSPSTSASGTAGVDFSSATPSEINKTITVVDDKTDPLNPVTLGTWNWADGEHTFAYSLDKAGVAGKCTDYTNTARISETGQNDTQEVTVCVGKNLTVSKTAVGTKARTYNWLIDKSVDETQINIADGGTATFNYSVKVTPYSYTDSGWTLGGEITISNPNAWEDITVSVVDTLDQGGTCSITEAAPYIVPKSGSLTLHYTCTNDGSPTMNTATVTWDKDTYFTPTGSASDDAAVSFVLSGETNKTITVIDDQTDPANPITLGTSDYYDGPFEFNYSLSKSGEAGKCTDYTNTAVIDETKQRDSQRVTVCVGSDLTVEKTAAGTFNRTYLWSISKAVDQTLVKIAEGGDYTFHYTVNVAQTGISDSGWTLGGKITITNPNDWEDITLTGLTDEVTNGGVCTVDPGPYVIPKSGSLEVNYSCAFVSAPTSYIGTNTVYITWSATTFHTPTGAANKSAPFTLTQLGSTNKTIHVTDSYAHDLGTVTATDAAPFTTATFNYDRTESGVAGTCTQYDNTAEITETGQDADKSVILCVGSDLTVTKTAEGTFNREYLWDISKAVDNTQINIANGSTATFNYTVNVAQTGFTDSGWVLGGTITVSNPNDWEDITATITDSVDIGDDVVCTVEDGVGVVILAGKSVERTYTCTFASKPGYTGTNTATATWDKAAYFTPNNSESGAAEISLEQVGAQNKVITVIDPLNGEDPLGTLTATDAEPFASAEYEYSHGFAGIPGTCTDFDNTATIVETKQSADQSVKVCVGLNLTVSKTATPSFTRTWGWTITKGNDATYNMFAGDSVTHGYTVAVAPTPIDSAWKVVGVITISNPNDWEDIDANVADATSLGGTCTLDDPTQATISVPKRGSVQVPYTCTWGTKPTSYSGTNTATVTWVKETYFTPNGSASGASEFEFTNPTEINPVITVDDDNLTGEEWSADRTGAGWAYSKDFACSTDPDDYADGKYSYSHLNTATIKETGQTDTATVDVTCTYPQLKVNKTVNMLPFSGPVVTFQLRQGASMTSLGTILETGEANLDNNGQVVFTRLLKPGIYQLVELIPVGYVPSYVWGTYGVEWFRPGYLPGQGGEDPIIWVAVNFVVNADGSITYQPGPAQQNVPLGGIVNIDNQVGQMPFTIGYWKNHASAKENNGGQDPVLDQMLYKATQAGQTITIGTLPLPGGITPDNAGVSATYAVRLLNKSTVETNKKKASDPAWNLAAQLLGYRLNAVFGSWLNPVAYQAADIAQAMLVNVGFDGQSYTKPPKAIQAKWTANMNYLAKVLDAYNNSTLVITSLTMPYPEVGY